MNRAYSILEIKSVNDGDRIIEGIASTPTPDRVGDVVEPLGAKFSLPMPLLWQHDSEQPIGSVTYAKPNKNGIPFKAQLASIDEPGALKDRLDMAWQSLKIGLVRAVSIGFRALEYSYMEETNGIRFLEWEWMELSAVTIPAQAEATINVIRSIERQAFKTLGKQFGELPDLTGARLIKTVSETPARLARTVKLAGSADPSSTNRTRTDMKTIAEQIAGFQATRATKAARVLAIINDSGEKGETLDAAQQEEHDGLVADLKAIDEHLARLEGAQKLNLAQATAVDPIVVMTDKTAADSRSPIRVQVIPKKVLPGIGLTRFVIAMTRANGNIVHAASIAAANEQWKAETPEVAGAFGEILKVGVPAASTTDTAWSNMAVNYTIMQDEFIAYLRPLTIIGRLPLLTKVPFNVKIGRQTGGSSVGWVGQGAPTPVTTISGDNVSLDQAKISGIIVLNEEFVRISNPNAELLVRNDLARGLIQFMDGQFVDPTKSVQPGVSPASITNGVTPTIPSGTTGAALRADVKATLSTFLAANLQAASTAVIMSQRLALSISMMQNALGQNEYPDLDATGGKAWGLPVITSEGVPSTGGSPADGDPIIFVSQADVLLADDGEVTIDASTEATLQMDTAPDSPPTASTVYYSLYQNSGIAVRAKRYINWAKRRSTAVAYISNAKYFE